MKKLSVVALAGILGLGVAASAQAPDPIVGTWTLDVAKSTYKPGPAPKSAVVMIEAAGKGYKISIDSVGADGAAMKWGWTNTEDGKEFAITGNPMYDAGTTTRTSPKEGTNVYKKAGKTIVTAKTSVSADGKTLTVTSTGTDARGQAINNMAIYTRK
jgi:uncharacterized protein (DUF2147 family)